LSDYRRKDPYVKAIRWLGDNEKEIKRFLRGRHYYKDTKYGRPESSFIPLVIDSCIGGATVLNIGDYLVFDPRLEIYYVETPEAFSYNYEWVRDRY